MNMGVSQEHCELDLFRLVGKLRDGVSRLSLVSLDVNRFVFVISLTALGKSSPKSSAVIGWGTQVPIIGI